LRIASDGAMIFFAAVALLRSGRGAALRTLQTTAAVPLSPLASDKVSMRRASEVSEFRGDALVVALPAGGEVKGVAAAVDELVEGAVSDLAADFEGELGATVVARLGRGAAVRTLALFGLGEGGRGGEKLGAFVAEVSKSAKAKEVGVAGEVEAGLVSRGIARALYVDNRFRSGKSVVEPAPLETVAMLGPGEEDVAEAMARARKVASGVALARDVVGAPANVLTPASLARLATALAESSERVEAVVLDRAACEARGMGSYLGVANGAAPENGAQFIHLTYRGPSSAPGARRASIALVGKGLTYDSGGYNLKAGPGSMIEKMKFDCGGAAAVLGAARAVAALELPDLDCHFVVAACENMISAEAMRPGDILTASNGKTIEVANTDAEGRLTLADALIYAETECDPDALVDVATLTGACVVALGNLVAGLFATDDALAAQLDQAATHAGEHLWRLPLHDDYDDLIKSKIADLKNVGGRPAGSITAALFLKHFVSRPWAHLDIAGPVWDDKLDAATGFGVATLVEFLQARAAAAADLDAKGHPSEKPADDH